MVAKSRTNGSASATLQHYGIEDFTDRVAHALEQAQLGSGQLGLEDLAPLDQFHARGLEATEELAARLDLPDGAAMLDVGCGLGGPARYLASLGKWRITGIDLNPSYIAVARMLTERTGLAGRIDFQAADALDLPFPDDSFDGAWTLQVAMNISDRPRLYRGLHRVIKPGGRLAVYTVVGGTRGSLIFPVPWAHRQETSFLPLPEGLRALLKAAGWREISWIDKTADVLRWFAEQPPNSFDRDGAPLGLHLVMGPEFPGMMANFRRNLTEGRAGLIQTVLTKD